MEQINNLKINMAEIKKDICYIRKSVDEHGKRFETNETAHDEIKKMIQGNLQAVQKLHESHCTKIETILKDHNDESRKIFAKKWVESFLIWAGGVVGTLTLTGLIYLIIHTYLHINL